MGSPTTVIQLHGLVARRTACRSAGSPLIHPGRSVKSSTSLPTDSSRAIFPLGLLDRAPPFVPLASSDSYLWSTSSGLSSSTRTARGLMGRWCCIPVYMLLVLRLGLYDAALHPCIYPTVCLSPVVPGQHPERATSSFIRPSWLRSISSHWFFAWDKGQPYTSGLRLTWILAIGPQRFCSRIRA